MKINDFKLERFFAKYEFSAPYILCASDCESLKVEDLFKLDKNAEKDFKKLWLGYTESLGHPLLREEISKLYQHSKPDHIIVFSGAEEGIFAFMNALLDPNDHIIVQSPCYQSLTEVAHAIGSRVTPWPMNPENNWELDIHFLEKNITANTKTIVVNFPNNPTGYLPSKAFFNRIIEIARQNDIFVFSDEVYRFLEYNEKNRLPAICDVYEKGVSLGVMSKSFGLPGLRIGWMVTGNQSLFDKIASYKDFTTICNSGPSEFLAILALKNKALILNRNLEIITANLQHLESFFSRNSHFFDWVKPNAGSLIFPRLIFTGDAEAFCLDLLDKKGVLLASGNQFNYSNQYVRFGFGRKNMPEALQKLEEYLTQ
ncbi:MAG: aminotransferase class I/II-fold pyridoxal phosphate-dependent enzyme [Candidatus Aminicenantes bacterium]|nr:MAG: aminotransferase class I/II-fold pyridoxal phosphate-dependent enzyme [Candidatus Aminicenantes bacterium]